MPSFCKEINCNKRASYNYEGEKKYMYCKEHKKENMINIAEKRICKEFNCNKRASYNNLNS